MPIPIRNIVFDKIKNAGSLTDLELAKSLVKDEHIIPEDRFNKLLLDLEIIGLIKVSWMTKDERRVEVCAIEKETDDVDEQIRASEERDYEASFPGFEK